MVQDTIQVIEGSVVVTSAVSQIESILVVANPEAYIGRTWPTPGEEQVREGYEAMAVENSLLAEISLPIALEVWPAWET